MEILLTYLVYNSVLFLPILIFKPGYFRGLNGLLISFFAIYTIFIVSIRDNVGRDFGNYAFIYNNIGSYERLEWGVKSIIEFLNFFDFSEHSFFVLMAFLTYIPVFLAYKKVNNALFIFTWIILFFLPSLNQVRQYAVVGLFMLALVYLRDDRGYRYYFLVILASSLHITGLLGFLFPLLSKIKIGKLHWLVLFSPLFIWIDFVDLLLKTGFFNDSYYLFYLKDSEIYASKQTISLGGMSRVILSYLFIYYFKDNKDRFINLISNMLSIYIILYFISLNFYILYRVYILFLLALPFAVCFLYEKFNLNKRVLLFFYFLIFLLIYQKSIYEQRIYPEPQGNAIYPYQTIFHNNILNQTVNE